MPASTSKRPGIPGKDQRDTRSGEFRTMTLRMVSSFLQAQNYTGDLSMKMLASPPAKEVQAIVKAFVFFLDPNYVWGRGGVKFEDELIPLLRGMKYPYTDGVNKTTLQTPGSMPNMPHVIGLLHWLVTVAKLREAYLTSTDDTLLEVNDVPDNFDDDLHCRVIEFDYTGKAYVAFLNGSDSFDEEDRDLEDRFARRNESVLKRNDKMRSELDRLEAEYKQLTSVESPVIALTKLKDERERDLHKMNTMIKKDQAKADRYLRAMEEINARIAQEAADIEALREERDELERRVAEQNISPIEAQQMTRDREQLTRTVDELKAKVEATKRSYEVLEVTWMNRSDQLEHAVEEYTSLALKLDLQHPPSPYKSVDFNLTLDLLNEPMLRCEDLRGTIKPALLAVAEKARQQRSQVADEQIRLEHELDTLHNACEQLEDDLVRLDARVASVLEEADNIRETAQAETAASDAEAAKLDKEIGAARAAAKNYGIGVKSRLQTLLIQQQEQMDQTERLREETLKAISKNTAEIATFKTMVSEVLDDLYLSAEAN
ncbi:hypothetical protein AURDEDRAFT_82532 [Auricularia subglabra TFB-10046 SS5]|nr:hypothetical protein AURDEDRAFT_82532 [Auricularia subglabra TFB-10046 SS5]